jgi:hypothetical protein
MYKLISEVENKIENLKTYMRFLKCIENPCRQNNVAFFKRKNIRLFEREFIGILNHFVEENSKDKNITDLYYILKLNVGGKKRKMASVSKPRKKRKVSIEFYNWIKDLLPDFILSKYNITRPNKIKVLNNLIPRKIVNISKDMMDIMFLGNYVTKFLKIEGLKKYIKLSYNYFIHGGVYKNIKEEEDFHLYYYKELIISANINLLRTICPNYVDTKYITKYYTTSKDIEYVIIMEKILTFETTEDLIRRNIARPYTYKIIYLQLIYALYCGDKWLSFRHNDLYRRNIGFSYIPKGIEKIIYIFNSENKYSFDVENFPFFVKIFDFGHSEINPINKNENIIIEKSIDVYQRERKNRDDLYTLRDDLSRLFGLGISLDKRYGEFAEMIESKGLQQSENYFLELIKLDFFKSHKLSDEEFNNIKNRKNVLIYEYKDMPKLELFPKKFYLWKDDDLEYFIYDYLIIVYIKAGNFKKVKLLLNDKRVDPSAGFNEPIIQAVRNNSIDIVKLLLNDKRVDPGDRDNEAIIRAVKNNSIGIVKLLLTDKRVDPGARDNKAIIKAVKKNMIDIVKLLLNDNRVNPGARDNEAINTAVRFNRVDIVKLLLNDKRVDPTDENNVIIFIAVKFNRVDIVKLLLNDKRADPTVDDNNLIFIAVEKNHIKILKLLLNDPRVDPSDRNNRAIIQAVRNNNIEALELLVNDTRINITNQLIQHLKLKYSYNINKILRISRDKVISKKLDDFLIKLRR